MSDSEVSQNEKSKDVYSSRVNKLIVRRKLMKRLVKNFLRRFCQGFSGGIILYAGVRIVTALLKNPFRESIPKICDGILSKDCVKVSAFVGLYPSVYHLLVELLTILREKHDGWTYGVSGGLAGLSVGILNRTNRQTLAFFTLARALGAGTSTLVARGVFPAVPFFEVLVFSLCTSIILYCVVLTPSYLNPGYYKSILKWSRDYNDGLIQKMYRTPRPTFVSCEEAGLHKGDCFKHRLKDFLLSLPGFAKLYFPIHLTPILVFKRHILIQRTSYVLQSLLKNTAISTLFLGLMIFLAKLSICVLHNFSHHSPPILGYIPTLSGAICGLALFLERQSRRKELSLFVIPHTINILFIAMKKSKFKNLLRVPHGFTLLFAVSMMSIMHAYEREPESLTLLINGLLKYFVGPRTNSKRSKQKK